MYALKIKRYQLFNRQEELDLIERWRRDGDKKALEQLVESQMALARRFVVYKYKQILRIETVDRGSILFQELESDAHYGIIQAIKKFKPELGFRLATLTGVTVRQAMNRRDPGGPIRVPQINVNEGSSKEAVEARKQLRYAAQHPTRLSVQYRYARQGPGYYDLEDIEPAWLDSIGERLELRDDLIELVRAFNVLPNRWKLVLYYRFAKEETLEEVGKRIGVTKERVRQIHWDAIKRLREAMGVME